MAPADIASYTVVVFDDCIILILLNEIIDTNAYKRENLKEYHASCQNVWNELTFLLDSIFIQVGTKLYRQVVGIPMGTNCAWLLVYSCSVMRGTLWFFFLIISRLLLLAL